MNVTSTAGKGSTLSFTIPFSTDMMKSSMKYLKNNGKSMHSVSFNSGKNFVISSRRKSNKSTSNRISTKSSEKSNESNSNMEISSKDIRQTGVRPSLTLFKYSSKKLGESSNKSGESSKNTEELTGSYKNDQVQCPTPVDKDEYLAIRVSTNTNDDSSLTSPTNELNNFIHNKNMNNNFHNTTNNTHLLVLETLNEVSEKSSKTINEVSSKSSKTINDFNMISIDENSTITKLPKVEPITTNTNMTTTTPLSTTVTTTAIVTSTNNTNTNVDINTVNNTVMPFLDPNAVDTNTIASTTVCPSVITSSDLVSLTSNNTNNNTATTVTDQLLTLIVEDVLSTRKLFQNLLKKKNLESVLAVDGQEAVAEVLKDMHKYKLILMDNLMPNMNGVEATRILRQAGYPYLIIGVTGNVFEDDIKEYLHVGADLIIPKPLRLATLDKIVNYINSNGLLSKHPDFKLIEHGFTYIWQ